MLLNIYLRLYLHYTAPPHAQVKTLKTADVNMHTMQLINEIISMTERLSYNIVTVMSDSLS